MIADFVKREYRNCRRNLITSARYGAHRTRPGVSGNFVSPALAQLVGAADALAGGMRPSGDRARLDGHVHPRHAVSSRQSRAAPPALAAGGFGLPRLPVRIAGGGAGRLSGPHGCVRAGRRDVLRNIFLSAGTISRLRACVPKWPRRSESARTISAGRAAIAASRRLGCGSPGAKSPASIRRSESKSRPARCIARNTAPRNYARPWAKVDEANLFYVNVPYGDSGAYVWI